MPDIVTIHGDREFRARTKRLFGSTREEFVCAARDLDVFSSRDTREAALSRIRDDGTRVAARKLLSPVALADERDRQHLRELALMGAQVRIAATSLPHETIILDRRVAILAGDGARAGRDYVVTSARTLVSGVYSLFEAAWETATDVAAFLGSERPDLNTQEQTILRALGSGVTDQIAAGNLGVSLRTYRRRVAELLKSLNADSRFQAGVRVGELGLIR